MDNTALTLQFNKTALGEVLLSDSTDSALPLATGKNHIMPTEPQPDLKVVDYTTTGAYASGGINHYRPARDGKIVTCPHVCACPPLAIICSDGYGYPSAIGTTNRLRNRDA